MRPIDLIAGVGGRRRAWLRPLDGVAERAGAQAGPAPGPAPVPVPGPVAGAEALLARLLVAAEDAVGPMEVAALALADRDRLLAAVWDEAYGPRIEADGRCTGCGGGYALAFTLDDLAAAALGGGPLPDGPDAAGRFRLDDVVFRLPTARDAAAAGRAPDPGAAMLAACVIEGAVAGREAAVEAAIAAAGPVLDVDLAATCPDCGAAQAPRFRLDAFLAASLAAEGPLRQREIHCLATAYRWSHEAILALPRGERQGYVRLILEAWGHAAGTGRP
ncbi:MAG: hypothetical protein AAFV86_00735, partial [Pseudomonadota bacterium]